MPRKSPPPKDNRFAGVVKCLRCDQRFYSWDRRYNRICLSCKEYLQKESSAEPIYRIPKRHIPSPDE